MTPELLGEVLGLNLLTRNNSPSRIERIVRKLERLLAAAEARKGVQNGTMDGTIFHPSAG